MKPFCETYLRDICVCEGSWHLAMSFFCYHFPFGETQKAWHKKIYKRRTYKLQKKKQKEITEEKIYKRKNLQKKKKHKREKFLNLQKTKQKQIFTKDKRQHKIFYTKDKAKQIFYKRETEKRNAKRKDRRTRRESPWKQEKSASSVWGMSVRTLRTA